MNVCSVSSIIHLTAESNATTTKKIRTILSEAKKYWDKGAAGRPGPQDICDVGCSVGISTEYVALAHSFTAKSITGIYVCAHAFHFCVFFISSLCRIYVSKLFDWIVRLFHWVFLHSLRICLYVCMVSSITWYVYIYEWPILAALGHQIPCTNPCMYMSNTKYFMFFAISTLGIDLSPYYLAVAMSRAKDCDGRDRASRLFRYESWNDFVDDVRTRIWLG